MLFVRSTRYDYRLRALTTESDNLGLKVSQKYAHFNTQEKKVRQTVSRYCRVHSRH